MRQKNPLLFFDNGFACFFYGSSCGVIGVGKVGHLDWVIFWVYKISGINFVRGRGKNGAVPQPAFPTKTKTAPW